MGKIFTGLVSGLIRTFSHRMTTEWEVPYENGPCVFVANYYGAIGPLEMCVKFPLRDQCHPWINEEMLEARKAPSYIRKDYWWKPGTVFEPLLKVTVPYIAAAVLPPVLRNVKSIPVYHDQRIILTLRQSIRALQKDESLIVFPEQPSRWLPQQELLNTSWLRLGEMWYRTCGRALKLYPVHIDRKRHVFKVAAPVMYDPSRRFTEQEEELAARLAKGLRGE